MLNFGASKPRVKGGPLDPWPGAVCLCVCRILIGVHTLICWSLLMFVSQQVWLQLNWFIAVDLLITSYVCFTTSMITVELVYCCDYVQHVNYQTTLLVRLYCLAMTLDCYDCLLSMPLSRIPDQQCHWLFPAGWLIGGCCCVCGGSLIWCSWQLGQFLFWDNSVVGS